MTTRLSGGESVLPVFSSEEDAASFIRSGTGVWRARRIGAGELVSVLSGPCGDVEYVALDPWPKITPEAALGLVGVSRESFVGAGSKCGA